MGRRGNSEEWLQPGKLLYLQSVVRDGLTDKEIARKMGIGIRTLYEWKNKFPQIAQALKNGKEEADAVVEQALYKAAVNGEAWAVCFWLKNRMPSKWRDKPEENGANVTVVINNDYGEMDDADNRIAYNGEVESGI